MCAGSRDQRDSYFVICTSNWSREASQHCSPTHPGSNKSSNLFWRRMPFRTTRRTCSCSSMPHAWYENHASTDPLTPTTGSMRLYDNKGKRGPLKPLWAPFAWYFVRTATWDAGDSEPAKPRPHQRRLLRTSTEKRTTHFPGAWYCNVIERWRPMRLYGLD